MIKLCAICVLILLAVTAGFTDEKEVPFLQIGKANFWKYNVTTADSNKTWKIVVEGIDKNGDFEVKVYEKQKNVETMIWRICEDSLVWRMAKDEEWKVLKFDAKKCDNWSSEMGSGKVVRKSQVVDIEDVQTPTGEFKKCLKVEVIDKDGPGHQYMWWARGVGLVKLETASGNLKWILNSYKVEPDISDKKLQEMFNKADAVALVSITKDAEKPEDIDIKYLGLYKGEIDTPDCKVTVKKSPDTENTYKLEEGYFIILLKKEKEEKYTLLHSPVPASNQALGQASELVKARKDDSEILKSLCIKAPIITVVEVVKIERRAEFDYYVVKVISALKGTTAGKHLDVLKVFGMKLKEKGKYILFLMETKHNNRKMKKPLDVIRAIFDFDSKLIKKLAEVIKGL